MGMLKRLFFFFLINALVILTLSIVMSVLGIQPYLSARGIDYEALMGFCLIWGMGGALISLAMSRMMAKWMMGVKVIDPKASSDASLQRLVEMVHRLARQAGLSVMPQVGIYESPDVNAFATGPTRSRSLVAVSTGLLRRMETHEVEGVLAHEIAHVANGDMVTMTLLQGVVNAFVMFLARVIAFAIMNMGKSRDDNNSSATMGFAYHITVWVLEIVFMIMGSMVVAWFSRYREFRADAGGAKLAGKSKMIAALEKLKRGMELPETEGAAPSFQAMQISSRRGGWLSLLATHPPLEDRIAALQGKMIS